MAREYIITMTATNRVGVLAAVTNAMAELGGDLCECSQTVVRGFFTMIFAAKFPDERDTQVILDHLHGVCAAFGIDVTLKDPLLAELPDAVNPDPDRMFHFVIEGDNVPGILRRIAAELSLLSVDIYGIRALSIDSGQQFRMHMKLILPEPVDPSGIEHRLSRMGDLDGFAVTLSSDAHLPTTGR